MKAYSLAILLCQCISEWGQTKCLPFEFDLQDSLKVISHNKKTLGKHGVVSGAKNISVAQVLWSVCCGQCADDKAL